MFIQEFALMKCARLKQELLSLFYNGLFTLKCFDNIKIWECSLDLRKTFPEHCHFELFIVASKKLADFFFLASQKTIISAKPCEQD